MEGFRKIIVGTLDEIFRIYVYQFKATAGDTVK